MKQLHRGLLLFLMLSASLIASAQTYTYSYTPSMGSWNTDYSSSGTVSGPTIIYSSGKIGSGSASYTAGMIKSKISSHSQGTITFTVQKTSGYFKKGNSGKIFIWDTYNGVVHTTSWSITNETTSTITAKATGYSNFEQKINFQVFLITSDQVYKQWGGSFYVTGSKSLLPPTVTEAQASSVTSSSAFVEAYVNPQGSATTYYIEYSTNSSGSWEIAKQGSLSASTSDKYVSATLSELTPNTSYTCRVRAKNSGGETTGDWGRFTTQDAKGKPVVGLYQTTNLSDTQITLNGFVTSNRATTNAYFMYGKTSSYGNTTSSKTFSATVVEGSITARITGLEPNTTYHYCLYASNSEGSVKTADCTFTTWKKADVYPIISSVVATEIKDNSVRLSAYVNPYGAKTTCKFEYGTTTAYGKVASSQTIAEGVTYNNEVYAAISGLAPGTTYHYRVVATNDISGSFYSDDYTFTTTGAASDSPFSDVTPDHCGSTSYGKEVYEAAVYLYKKGIIEGSNGKLLPDDNVTRAQLAKMSLYALYGGETKVPSTLITDNFPSIYTDLQDKSTYYYRAAKALLYLEYKDGRSPFDRNRSAFFPNDPIERNLVMKVFCETFNIVPLSSGSTPFSDFTSVQNGWGYAAKAYNLGITTAKEFKPFTQCTRGDAILFLYRILTGGKVTIPTPNNTEDYSSSDFFIPANYKPSNVNVLKGISSGNFNYYEKDFFNIDGYVPLNFGITYNSCLTELPSTFYPVSPMGTGWSHSYNIYMSVIDASDYSSLTYVVHKADGSMMMYDSSLKSLSDGNYFTLSKNSSSSFTLSSPDKVNYTFERYSTSDGIFYLTKITDIHGNEKTISYESGNSHRRIARISALGRSLTFSYQSGTDLLKSVTDPSGRTVYFYYTNSLLSSLTDAKGQKTSFNYGTNDAESGLLKTITLPRGNTITNKYQQRKLTSTQTNSNTPTTVKISSSYANGRTTSQVTQPITNSKSLTTNYAMDANGNITSAVDNESTDISITYGDSNNPTLPTKLKNNITGVTSTITYNAYGLPTSTKITGGGISISTSTTYNSDNQVTSSTDANGNITRFSYSNGALTSVTDALGNVTRFTNNSYGSPTQITDACGRKLDITYNSYGNMTSSTLSALGISNSFVYDAISRITESTDGNGNSSTYTYDKNDNILSFTDPKNNTISYKYDANDNLTGITNAKGGVTSLTYDSEDLLTGQSFQGHDKSFTYYESGALETSTTADGTTFSYTYDDAGRVTDNDYASFDYNMEGKLVTVSKDGKDIDYSYDGIGRLSSVEYDGKEVSYEYDNNGNTTAITYPGGNTVYYTFDALNRVTAVTDWNGAKTTYGYNADGSLDYMQLPNKVKTTYSYDSGGRLIGISTKRSNGSTIVGYGYTLDDNGNHISVEVNDVFDHDPILESEDIRYSYNSDNRITKAGGISFGFDGNGNTTSRTGRTMRYDKINNLTSVSGDFNATYTYDGLGQRRSATRNGVTTKYVLSGNSVVAETNSSGTVQYYYIYGPTGLISRISASGDSRYYVADVRGSIVAMTDASTSANLTHRYQYDEFGKVTSAEEEDLNRFRYVGNKGVMYETENLTFMRARYYDESIGRFLSEDPIWSTNLYPYCYNNPLRMIDPEGTSGIETAVEYISAHPRESMNVSWNSIAQDVNKIKNIVDPETLHADDFLNNSLSNMPDAQSNLVKQTGETLAENSESSAITSVPIIGTVVGTVIGAAHWDSSRPYESIGNIASGMAHGAASDLVSTTGLGVGGKLALGTAVNGLVSGAIEGVGKVIDSTSFEDWVEKKMEKRYVHDYRSSSSLTIYEL